mmetsp:Transcript_26873/g.75348  ORF Transcript_26873/g.75348 Transcript_26873/m.75348 type:complete len:860 (+) Transcript_26873:147-2726(+)
MASSMCRLILGLLAGTAAAQPSSLRIWATDSFVDGVQESLKPVIADIVCSIPMSRVLDGDSIKEGPVEIVVNDFKLSNCVVHDFTVRDEQGGIMISIAGLSANTWGSTIARQADCSFMCSGPLDAKFTADMRDSNIAMVINLESYHGKPIVNVRSISTDIHLSNIKLQDFHGLSPFANLVSGVIEKATNSLTARKLTSTVNKVSGIFGRLPFHGLHVGDLVGNYIPRAANLQFDADVNSIHYVRPAWVLDVLTVLSSPPEVGRRSFPYGPSALPSTPPMDHRSQQIIATATPWAINQAVYTLEKLGLLSDQLDADVHGIRVPVRVSNSPTMSIVGKRAEFSLNSTYASPSERTNSTITVAADSPRLLLSKNLLTAEVSGLFDFRADVEGCSARSASIRHTPLPGSPAAIENKPEIALKMISGGTAPWWNTTCDTQGSNMLMSMLGFDNIVATAECVHQGLKGEISSSETIECLLGVWESKLDWILSLILRLDAMRPDGMPDLLYFVWEQVVAINEEVIKGSAGGGPSSLEVQALHACVDGRTRHTAASETFRCLLAAAGPAIDASYPSLLDFMSVILTPQLATLADEIFEGSAPSDVPTVIQRVNAIASRDSQPTQQVVDELMRILHEALEAFNESPGSERTDALLITFKKLVSTIWSALDHVSISLDGLPVDSTFDIANLDDLIDRIFAALESGQSLEWALHGQDANLIGTYSRSFVSYVIHPPAALQAEVQLDSIFEATGIAMAHMSLTPRISTMRAHEAAGSLRLGYRADSHGVDYMFEADWKAIFLKLLESLDLGSIASAVRALPGWVDRLVAGWENGHFWGSFSLDIDGGKILTGVPLVMDEIFEAKYTSQIAT